MFLREEAGEGGFGGIVISVAGRDRVGAGGVAPPA